MIEGARTSVDLPAVDGFRALGAMLVVFTHCWLWTGAGALDHGLLSGIVGGGADGVDYLLVLSGFLMFMPAALNQGSLGDMRAYAVRRTARIVPAYYISLVAAFALRPLLMNSGLVRGLGSTPVPLAFLAHLTFIHNAVIPFDNLGFGVSAAVWTLGIEAAFYLVLPLVAGAYFRRPWLGLGAAYILTGLWSLPGSHYGRLTFQLPTFADQIAVGMTAAAIYARYRGRDRVGPLPARWLPAVALAAWPVVLGIALLGGLRHIEVATFTDNAPVAAAFGVLLLATVLSPAWVQWPVTLPAVRFIGRISYGIYLFHILVFKGLLAHAPIPHDGHFRSAVLLFVLGFPPTILAGWLSYRLVEQPVRRRAGAVTRRWRSPATNMAPLTDRA